MQGVRLDPDLASGKPQRAIAVTLGTFDTPYEGKVTHDLHLDSKPGWLP
ncbi:hypothetical protein LP420_24595 [Massilia sp. B-10]|nr:hypothetical protein LP420_24595 [Massilia sp. B-10]